MNKKNLKSLLQGLKSVSNDDEYGILESIRLLLEAMDEAGDSNITIFSSPIIVDITRDNITIGYNDDNGETDIAILCDITLSDQNVTYL